MSEISIVTAFFDIGRGDWTPDKGLPHYLKRTTDTYLERFGHMAKLENEMVIFTSNDLVDKIKELRGDNPTHIITLDFPNSFSKLRDEVTRIQKDPVYQSKIDPSQLKNPEYWNADYVVVNALKSSFVIQALKSGAITNQMVAWLDFGYCRDESTLNGITKWTTNLSNDKIHLFNIKEWAEGTTILDVISKNDVHITGPCIVAPVNLWPSLEALTHHSIGELLKHDLIDDDQTLLLMSYLFRTDLFELHPVPASNWFVVFKDFSQ